MRTTKKDATFYCFEKVALATIVDVDRRDDYLDEEGCKALMQRVSDSYQIVCPGFKYTRKDSRYCYYMRYAHVICFNYYWGMTQTVVLHELAHALTPNGVEIHGPEYLRVWIDIFSRHYDIPAYKFECLARDRGLTVLPSTQKCGGYKPKYG